MFSVAEDLDIGDVVHRKGWLIAGATSRCFEQYQANVTKYGMQVFNIKALVYTFLNNAFTQESTVHC